MDASTFSIIYMVGTIVSTALISQLNQRTGMHTTHRESDMVVALGMSGQYGAGALILDTKLMYGGVLIMTMVVGGVFGYAIPLTWVLTAEPAPMERAAQIVGAIFWGVNFVQLLGWFRMAVMGGLALAFLAAIVILPYQYIAHGEIGFRKDYANLGNDSPNFFEKKLAEWRASQLKNIMPPSTKSDNRTTPVSLSKFAGMWKGDNKHPYIEITKSGSLILSNLKRIKLDRPFYGNDDIIMMDGGDIYGPMLFRVVDEDTLERVGFNGERLPVSVESTLNRVDRTEGIKESDAIISAWEKKYGEADRKRTAIVRANASRP